MTISVNGNEIGELIAIAATVGSLIAMLIVGLLVYLMVRPPRHVRERRKAEKRGDLMRETDPAEAEELWLVVDRMEARLDVLERALADELGRTAIGGRREKTLMAAQDGRNTQTEE